MLILSDVHYTPEQLQRAGRPRRSRRLPRRRAGRGQTTVRRHRRVVIALGAAGGRSRSFRRWTAARRDAEAEGGFRGLAQFPRYWLGVFAQFAYVGAQVGVWSFLIRYTQHNFPGTVEKDALRWLPISFGIFFAGRFIGTLLMSSVQPGEAAGRVRRHQRGVVPGCRGCRRAASGLTALIASSFFMSIMFPTIFSMSLRGLGVVHQVGLVVPRHGHHRRRGVHRRHGSRVA